MWILAFNIFLFIVVVYLSIAIGYNYFSRFLKEFFFPKHVRNGFIEKKNAITEHNYKSNLNLYGRQYYSKLIIAVMRYLGYIALLLANTVIILAIVYFAILQRFNPVYFKVVLFAVVTGYVLGYLFREKIKLEYYRPPSETFPPGSTRWKPPVSDRVVTTSAVLKYKRPYY